MHSLPYNPSKTAYGAVWLQNVNTGLGEFNPVFFVATAGGNHGYFSAVKDNTSANTMDVSEFDHAAADIGLQMSYFTDS